jgi:protease-4
MKARRVVLLLGCLGVVAVLLVVLGVWLSLAPGGQPMPRRAYLELDLERGLVEAVPEDPFAQAFGGERTTVRDVVDALARAAEDRRVTALVARVGAAPMGLAQVQEVRDAVAAFRAAGKPAIAWAETFGEFGPGNGSYYLASAFDEIHLLPSGDIGLTGLIYESPFLRGTLDKLGLVPRGDHRYEYKNALNTFTEREFTGPHEEALAAVMRSQFEQMVRGIAEGRGLSAEEVRGRFDRGPLLAQEALAAKLVDRLAYRDEVYDLVEERAGEGAEAVGLKHYLKRAGRPHRKGTVIALIYGVGGVARGESDYDPLTESVTMGSDTVAAAFRAAVEDEDVKAILFRVDSPGGSYVASDVIWRETRRAKDAGKPVIVSMGDLAGSGGYFVAMAADKIVAQPGTITGSIGVLTLKFLSEGFWGKLGISWDEVHTSANSQFWTGLADYTPEGWARFQAWLDRIYEDFTTKVAEGRGLPKEKVLEIAKGRIWSGEDAKALGLVDELGGFPVALRLAREAAGLAPDAPIRLKQFPPKKSFFQNLTSMFESASDQAAAGAAFARSVRALSPAARAAARLGLMGEPMELAMPPLILVQ